MMKRDETGAALPLTLVIMAVLTLLGFALLMFSLVETKQVFMDESRMKAHYVARSGAHAVAAYLLEHPEEAMELINRAESDDVTFAGGRFKVLVYGDPNDEIYIRSTGTVGGIVQRVVATVKNVGVDFALYGKSIAVSGNAARITGGDVIHGGYIDIKESVVVDGEIYELRRDFDPVILPWLDSKSVFFGRLPSYNLGDLKKGTVLTGDSLYRQISLSGKEELKIIPPAGQNLLLKADNISLGGNSTMTVVLNNNTVAIVADQFNSTGKSKVQAEGKGHLLFYVNNYVGGGTFQLAPDSNVQVNVFVTEGGSFDLAGTPNFKGSIYAPHASAVLFGNSTVTGWVIAEHVEGGGNIRLHYSPVQMAETSIDLLFLRLEKWRYDTE